VTADPDVNRSLKISGPPKPRFRKPQKAAAPCASTSPLLFNDSTEARKLMQAGQECKSCESPLVPCEISKLTSREPHWPARFRARRLYTDGDFRLQAAFSGQRNFLAKPRSTNAGLTRGDIVPQAVGFAPRFGDL